VDASAWRELALQTYDLVDKLPPGPQRVAAWNAYALQLYGDKLLECDDSAETRELARTCHRLAVDCVGGARTVDRVPRWHTPVRSVAQLRGMREALDALSTHVAYDVERRDDAAAFADELAAVEEKRRTVDLLWIRRPTPEIRGGLGDALMTGLDRVVALGQLAAAGSTPRAG
jgi:hypothetical protein